jgi:hypothetical protein
LKEHVRIPADEAPPTDDDLDLDREIEYAFDADEPMAGRAAKRRRRVDVGAVRSTPSSTRVNL